MRTTPGLRARLEADNGDIHIFTLTDSTGNSVDEWPGVLATSLYALYPSYTFVYEDWNYTTEGWDSPLTRHTGSGSNTVKIWNAGGPGYEATSFTSREIAIIQHPTTVDYIITGIGLNDPTSSEWDALLSMLQDNWPNAYISLATNNAVQADAPDYEGAEQALVRTKANEWGLGLFDIEKLFRDTGDVTAYLGVDEVHPNSAGSALWADFIATRISEEGGVVGILDSAVALYRASQYGGAGDWLDESGNGLNGSISGATYKGHSGRQYVWFPGAASNYVSAPRVNLVSSADTAHLHQGIGSWVGQTQGQPAWSTDTAGHFGDGSVLVTSAAAGQNRITADTWAVSASTQYTLSLYVENVSMTDTQISFGVDYYNGVTKGTFAFTEEDWPTGAGWVSITFTVPASHDGVKPFVWSDASAGGEAWRLGGVVLRAGTSTDFVPVWDVAGDFEIEAEIALDASPPAATVTVCGRYGASAATRHHALQITTGGNLKLSWYDSGGTGRSATSTAALSASAGDVVTVKVTVDVDNGSSDCDTTFYEDGVQLGSVVQLGATSSFQTGTTNVFEVGSIASGATDPFAGDIYSVTVRDGIGGPTVGLWASSDISSPADTSHSGSTDGRTYTLNRSSSGHMLNVIDRDWFFFSTDDYVEVADDAQLDFGASDPLTVVAVVRPYTVAAGSDVIVAKKDDLTTAAGWALVRASSAGQLVIADGTADDDDTAGTLVAHTASSIAGVRNVTDDDLEAFVDGAGSGSPTTDSTTATLANALPMRIGATSGTAANFFEGGIAAIAVFNAELTDYQVGVASNVLSGVRSGGRKVAFAGQELRTG